MRGMYGEGSVEQNINNYQKETAEKTPAVATV